MTVTKTTTILNKKNFSEPIFISKTTITKKASQKYFDSLIYRASNLFKITIINKKSFQYTHPTTKETIVFSLNGRA